MFSFFHTIFDNITSFLAAAIIAVGLAHAPVPAPSPTETQVIQTSTAGIVDQQVGDAKNATAELEAEKRKSQQLEQSLQQEKNLREVQQASALESQRQQELQRQKDQEQAKLLEQQQNVAAEEIKRQQELARQAELVHQEKLYQQKQQVLDDLISQINEINQRKIATENAYRAQEEQFVTTYCKQKEDEINNNYGIRGLYSSGARIQAIENLKITCPTEARNVFNASLDDKTYPFVIQLQQMQRQFQDYNKSLYSACSRVSTNCSTYLDAAFPINF